MDKNLMNSLGNLSGESSPPSSEPPSPEASTGQPSFAEQIGLTGYSKQELMRLEQELSGPDLHLLVELQEEGIHVPVDLAIDLYR